MKSPWNRPYAIHSGPALLGHSGDPVLPLCCPCFPLDLPLCYPCVALVLLVCCPRCCLQCCPCIGLVLSVRGPCAAPGTPLCCPCVARCVGRCVAPVLPLCCPCVARCVALCVARCVAPVLPLCRPCVDQVSLLHPQATQRRHQAQLKNQRKPMFVRCFQLKMDFQKITEMQSLGRHGSKTQ